jgi:hypothetical protein
MMGLGAISFENAFIPSKFLQTDPKLAANQFRHILDFVWNHPNITI